MTTRNFVPRNNNEGQLGTENKKWNKIYTNEIFATNFTGNLTGTADNAIKDNKNQQIDSTYIKDISVNNDTLTVTKGNDDSQDIIINNISHAINSDNATNANKLQELTAGNANGQIPINNGTENANLNAALLNGKASSYFATSNHTHTTATQSSNGYMSNADKKKLDGIASGAEVNQNAFANVKVGSTTISSDAKQDTLELAAGTNISLVGDANNDKVTIGVTGKVASATTADKVNGIASDGGSLELVRGTMAGSDSFRIRIGGSNDAGYAEIATADNGNDPIYVRQYGSRFTTATRTATILDSNGNTSFPGTVTAPNFNGKATKATQDGSGNTITTHYLSRNQSTQNDMNACTVEGIYRFSGTLSNAWTGTSWGTLLVLNNQYNGGSGVGGTYLVQMAFPTDGRIWMRQRVNADAWTGWVTLARTSDNVASATKATKATQDSAGQTINTTYVKGVTANNATLTITKGNGSTSTTTINNVSNATNANNLVISGGTSAHIKYGGGDVDENTAISQNKVNLLIGSWYSTGFRDLCSTGNPIRVAINHRNGNIKTTGNVIANGAMYSATPGTSDNSTRVATTAFVQSLINSLKGSIGGAIVASNLAQNGYVKFSNGLILQWGSCNSVGTTTFPISFLNKCLNIFGVNELYHCYTSVLGNGRREYYYAGQYIKSQTLINFTLEKYSGNEIYTSTSIKPLSYIAIGY
jgi:hypothetical protein